MKQEIIRQAEQEVRDLEKSYENTIKNLRPKMNRWDYQTGTYRREEFAVLGEIDGVDVIEVDKLPGGKNEYDSLSTSCKYKDQDYLWACSSLPWYNYNPMKRAVALNQQGLPHVFGIVQEGEYNPNEIGIYVPQDSLVEMRRLYVQEVLRDYPSLLINLEQIRNLNISSDFISNIHSSLKLNAIKNSKPLHHKVMVLPTEDGSAYTYDKTEASKWPEITTELEIGRLRAPEITLTDFSNGSRHDLLEMIRESIGAAAYYDVGGYGNGLQDFKFRFNHILSNEEIARALGCLGEAKKHLYQITLHKLTPKLRDLINLPLDKSTPSKIVRSYIDNDSKILKNPWGPEQYYNSICIF